MALVANALTTVATVKTELGITDGTQDTRLERLIAVASDAIERYCNRSFGRATGIVEDHPGHGGIRLSLARTPIESITSIAFDGTAIDATDYSVEDAAAGFVYRLNGWKWTAPWTKAPASQFQLPGTEEKLFRVTYVGGYVLPKDTVGVGQTRLPYDLEQACIDTVVQLYRNAGKYSNLQTETEMQGDATWRGHFIPGPALKILNRYRRII